jgi:protein SCO1/2
MRYFLLILLAVSIFSACQKSQPSTALASADAKHFSFKGKIISVDKAKKKATIAHDDIPGYMEAMTMEFPIREDWVWEDLTKDAQIQADLVVDKDGFWLEKIGIVAASNPNQAPLPPVNENFAQIGQEVPDFTLTNQDGKKISTGDFRGKALAVTFIYSRCPLPEYCVKMSKNFSDAALQLQNNSELKDKIRLLSISFDPQTDTPAKLKEYGLGYLGKNAKPDFSVWQLATGSEKEVRQIADFFGLRYQLNTQDKTQFDHSLRTIVITPEGKVHEIISGNEWTPSDLMRELKATIQ